MLDAFVIEELKRREQRQREERERPVIDLPIPEERPKRKSDTEDDEQPQRGVVVIDLSV